MPIKFSQFTNRTSDTATTTIVGFDGNQNIKILSSDLLSGFINGTVNTIPVFATANTLGDSIVSQDSSANELHIVSSTPLNTKVGIGTTSPDNSLHVKSDDSQVAKFESTNASKSMIVLENADSSNSIARLYIQSGRIVLGEANSANSGDNLKIQKPKTTNYGSANMDFGGTGVSSNSKFNLKYNYNTNQDTSFNGLYVDANVAGTDAITVDRTLTGINVDMDCNASGGNQTQELQLRGINVDVNNNTAGDANHIYGVYARASSIRNSTGDNISDITGGYFKALNSAQTGQVSNMYGTYSDTSIEDSTHTIGSVYGAFARAEITSSFDGTISTKAVGSRIVIHLDDTNDNVTPLLIGADVENVIDSNLATSEGVRVVKDINNNLTITDSYLFKGTVEKPASSTITNNWGLYLENIDKNYIDGNVGIGTNNPQSKLQINTGTDINAQFGLDTFGSFKLGDISNNYTGRGIYYDGTAGSEDLDVITNTFNIAGNSGEGIKVVSGSDVQLSSPAGVVLTIDGGNNYVGIGTENPSQKLDVVGSIEVSDGIYVGGTSSANKLDDYEEGSFTPTFTNSSGIAISYFAQFGSYVKVGRQVTCWGFISVNTLSYSGSTGTVGIDGLPFVAPLVSNQLGDMGNFNANWNLDPSPFRIKKQGSNNDLTIFKEGGTGAPVNMTGNYLASFTTCNFTITYYTAL